MTEVFWLALIVGLLCGYGIGLLHGGHIILRALRDRR
jgi:hypothetical protein